MTAASYQSGTLLDGRYSLGEKLGEGAFGVVYRAQQLFLGEVVGEVAVKFLSPPSDEARERVLGEVRAMAALSHPHLLGFRSAGAVDIAGRESDLFLVCELADGSLEDAARARLNLDESLELARQMALALEYLWARGVVHRDFKPANVLRVGGAWKIADFGLSRSLESALSHSFRIGGTPLYMAPEAWRGEISGAVDLWALGATLQWAFCARLPYERAKTQDEFCRMVQKQAPFIAPELPSPLREIVAGCLEKDPRKRLSAAQIVAKLQNAPVISGAEPSPPTAPLEGEISVDCAGNGDFLTLGEALENAAEGATICVAPGVYREPIALQKSVSIRALVPWQPGEDEANRVIFVWGAGNVLKIAGETKGTISGLCLQSDAAQNGARYFAASISAGEWLLDGCDLFCDSLGALKVAGEARVQLRDCQFASDRFDGILIDGGSCHILRCRCEENGRHGLFQKGAPREKTLVRESIFGENRACGAHIAAGEIAFDASVFERNRRAGIEVGDAQIELRRSQIALNRGHGIIAAVPSRGEVEACEWSGNEFGNFDVPRGARIEGLRN